MANTTVGLGTGAPVIDYEGSGYQQDFWEGKGREYEDAVERVALQALLPPQGRRLAEIGAGFGRLADLYQGYEQVILFDYSRTLLGQAVDRWGDDGRFVFVAGNIYQMPLATGVLDALTMVRVMHHLADVPGALAQLRRLLRPDGVAVLEYASKRHLKAIARWLLRQQDWSPFHQEPLEFVRLNFDFHPRWMDARLQEAGFRQEQRLAVSHFRLPALKRRVPHQTLVAWERPLLRLGGRFPLAPSVFVRVRPAEAASTSEAPSVPEADPEDVAALFRCPHCTTEPLQRKSEDRLTCPQCQRTYGRKGQIWDFKESLT